MPSNGVRQSPAESSSGPWAIQGGVALLAALATATVFGGLNAPAGWHDEAAYLLQARIFTDGQWAAPGPILPEFFEQYHVLVSPVLAAKYVPGHALALVPGVAVGWPGLMVVAMAAATSGLLFALVRRASGVTSAIIASLLWLVSPMAVFWRSSYMSEVTTSMLWLLGLWAAWRWYREGGIASAALTGLAAGAMAITRPLTALAFTLPLAIACIACAIRRRQYGACVSGLLCGGLCLVVLPVWSRCTAGSWTASPLSRYTREYMPYDHLGFGLHSAAVPSHGPPDLTELNAPYVRLHMAYTPRVAALAVVERAGFAGRHALSSAWLLLLLAMAAGSWALSWKGALVLAQGVLLFIAYGLYAHLPSWDVYYLETLAPLLGLGAAGMGVAVGRLGAWREWSPVARRRFECGLCAVVILLMLQGTPAAMASVARRQSHAKRLAKLTALAESPSIVFVRRNPGHSPDIPFVTASGPLAKASIWLVHDLGSRDACLAAAAPDRSLYLLDERAWRMTRLERATTQHAAVQAAECEGVALLIRGP